MIKTLLSCAICVTLLHCTQAQTIFIPRDVQQAYKKGTRSMDGKPGPHYWQNFGRYDIALSLAPPNKTIKGKETITYFNRSPDTIRNPVIKLILNAHTPGAIRQFPVSGEEFSSGIIIDALTENGQPKKFREKSTNTWQPLRLSKPLPPGDSLLLTFDWHFDLSTEKGREGIIDSTTFFLAYSYPRVAVLDDINGWDRMFFTGSQEFYNDFNDYKLTVTVPKNFIVWSTGTLQNPTEVLQPPFAQKLSESLTSDNILNIATPADLKAANITTQNDQNTWKWQATYVSDMAFGVSDHYNWDASSVIVDDATQRRASVQSAYKDDSKDFHSMVQFGKHSLDWLSHKWPGVAYPFPKSTIFQGFADMEYPMMVNDNTEEDPTFAQFVAEHEIAHTWFPFYMGINEHRYGFMDEGWTTAFEYMIGTDDLGKEKEDALFKQFRVENWALDNSEEHQLPIITPGNVLSGQGLGDNEYGKPALAYLAVKDLLGDDLFRKCLHEFMNRWNGKHPIPWDMFFSFNNISAKNLNWFWNNWFFSNNYIDISIQKVDSSKKGYTLTIDNIGGFAIPTDLLIEYTDASKETIHQTPAIWEQNQKQAKIEIPTKKKIKSITLDTGIYMDADPSNNQYKP